MLDPAALDSLFERYGFRTHKRPGGIRVYTTALGHFQIAEIVVPGDKTIEADNVSREFQNAGFACKVSRYTSPEEVEDELFRGFFKAADTSNRLRQEYSGFCKRNSESLGSAYSYVNVRYLLNGVSPANPTTVVDEIFQRLLGPGPSLVILEAPAGFGKTCTSFEVLQKFLDATPSKNPILAELQRNRQARIFRYVLLDEIDRNYQSLRSTIVEEEILSGRIPLILDGFDELLHVDREGQVQGGFTDLEPMLTTLRGILHRRAKVLVTTRKTAILGESFTEWLAQLAQSDDNDPVRVHRIALLEPETVDWIGPDRLSKLNACEVPIESLANPVLLSYVKNLNNDDFSKLCANPNNIVEKFLTSLLDRERSRQELPLGSDAQLQILTSLAERLVTGSSSSIGREELRRLILDRHYQMLRDALKSAPDIAAKTPEELADKLTDHALLDVKPGKSRGIGFVNDFVHGTLAARVMLEILPTAWFDESDLDKAVTAYRVRTALDRRQLWNRLAEPAQAMDGRWQVWFDLQLLNEISRSISGCEVEDTAFKDHLISPGHRLKEVIFIRCKFIGITFDPSEMIDVGFVSCEFSRCAIASSTTRATSWYSADCIETSGRVIGYQDTQTEQKTPVDVHAFNKRLLEQFWPIGRPHARLVLQNRTLYQGSPSHDRPMIQAAIDRLRADGLIEIEDNLVQLNQARMAEIRRILGR